MRFLLSLVTMARSSLILFLIIAHSCRSHKDYCNIDSEVSVLWVECNPYIHSAKDNGTDIKPEGNGTSFS